MRMYDIIHKKRDNIPLSDDEINWFVKNYTCGDIPDYQASALMMAIYFNGMSDRETAKLTDAMVKSGDCIDLSPFGSLTVDKHSTGGVGDKTTLVVAPIAASLGCIVAKMSGRGLGHTGGTVDKLESVKGYKSSLSPSDFFMQVKKSGISVIGQSGNLTPADKNLYALRDVTATVESIPLIASSIMSKKIAAGSHNIVLDVKVGSGAFCKTPEKAEALAEKMVQIGHDCGRNTAAIITNMDIPLGNAVGNSLEIAEAVEVLKGNGPADLRKVCTAIAARMVALALDMNIDDAEKSVENAISSGAAYNKFIEWISGQGGDISSIEDIAQSHGAKYTLAVKAEREGYISHMNTEKIGITSVMLGAGRTVKDEAIDHSAGIIIHAKTGDYINCNDTIATLYTNRQETLEQALREYLESIEFSQQKPCAVPLIYKTIIR